MERIDRQRVLRSFHRGAKEYDCHTPVQQRVLQRLLQRLEQSECEPAVRVLDIGCGTGCLLELLGQKYPDARMTGLDLAPNMLSQAAQRLGKSAQLFQGDAEQLPFSTAAFDLVLSSSTFQWLDHLEGCFGEMMRVLVPGGTVLFSLFGERTLYELHLSWQKALACCSCGAEYQYRNNSHRFHTAEQVRQALECSGFKDIQVWTEQEKIWYPDVPHLLQAIKKIGAGTTRPISSRGLGWRRVLHDMATRYEEQFGSAEGVPASYTVIYATGRS